METVRSLPFAMRALLGLALVALLVGGFVYALKRTSHGCASEFCVAPGTEERK